MFMSSACTHTFLQIVLTFSKLIFHSSATCTERIQGAAVTNERMREEEGDKQKIGNGASV